MPLAALVAPQIPFLRRYARALTGRQELGDAMVAAMLERLVAEPARFDTAVEPRVAVYRLFTETWNEGVRGRAASAATVADRRVAAITPLPRQAFLLTAVEGFSTAETARILAVAPEEVEGLLETAGQEIAAGVATRVLVIEDEPIIAMELESLVSGLGHGIIGNARTHREALDLVAREKPGLVLADIRLADGSSGLDAVKDILRDFDVPVIFITAYPEYLLTGERPEPTFLITKPFRDEMVRAVIAQALFFDLKPSVRRRT